MELMANQVSDKAGLIIHDNHTAKVEIAMALKKVYILGAITFENCNSF